LIVLNSATIDHFKDDELKFVLGHEYGHIQNAHVIYHLMVRWVTFPLSLYLQKWKRYSEITADRAGLICSGNLNSSIKALIKLALGSQKLYENIDVNEYLKQLGELKKTFGRFQEILLPHPFLPKRVEALRIFSKSKVYSKKGKEKKEVDKKVKTMLSVIG
jgi:Zn-dependent protease with chaperone function